MAKVKQLRNCSKCNAELLKKDQMICHECGFRLRTKESDRFAVPDYIYYQRQELVKGIAEPEKIAVINAEMNEALRASTTEDIFAALYDARARLANLVHTEMTLQDFLKYAKMGKAIGTLATTLENYAASQGVINASNRGINSAEVGDDEPGN